MERPHWDNWQLLEETRKATLNDVLDHMTNSLLQNVSLLCFAHGNVNRQQACAISFGYFYVRRYWGIWGGGQRGA